ncbi:MAG TPA: sialidase family protein [Nitrososphaera sp.]
MTLSSVLLTLLLVLASPLPTAPVSTASDGNDDDDGGAVASKIYKIGMENATGDKPDVFFARSVDGGETFSDPINLSDNENWTSHAKIAVAGDHVHVVWIDSEHELGEADEERGVITVRSSEDGGETFGDPVVLGDPDLPDVGEPFSRHNILEIEATTTGNSDESNVYISWVASGGGEGAGRLDFAKSDDSGQSFELQTDLVRYTDYIEMEIATSRNTDSIYIAGQSPSDGDITIPDQIFFLRSTDGGETFDEPVILQDVNPDVEDTLHFYSMEVDDDRIEITWLSGGRLLPVTLVAVSTDGGETWG